MPRLAPFIVLLATLALAACDRSGWRISHRLASAFESATTPIDMTQVAPFPWDRMCVLGPYSGPHHARALLGFDWAVDEESSIGGLDTISLLVFVEGQRVVAHAEHPRSQGELLALSPQCVDRGAARLVRVSAPGELMLLVTQAQARAEEAPTSRQPVASPASAASGATAGRRP